MAITNTSTPGAYPTWNPANISPYLSGLAGGDQDILSGFQSGLGIGQNLFGYGMLGSLPTGAEMMGGSPYQGSIDQAELLNRLYGESWIGGQRPQDVQAGLSRLNAGVGPSQYENQALSYLQNRAGTAGNLDPRVEQILAQRKAGLGGYDAAENQALREQGLAGIDQQMAQSMRSAGQGALASGMRGGAAAALAQPAMQQAMTGRQGLERQLMADNIAEKARRLNEYQGLVTSADQERFNRQGEAYRNLGDYASSVQGNTFNRGLGYSNALGTQNQAEIADRLNRLGLFQNYQTQLYNQNLNNTMFNLNQRNQELSGLQGWLLGGGQFAAGQQAANQAYDVGMAQAEAMGKPKTRITYNYTGVE